MAIIVTRAELDQFFSDVLFYSIPNKNKVINWWLQSAGGIIPVSFIVASGIAANPLGTQGGAVILTANYNRVDVAIAPDSSVKFAAAVVGDMRVVQNYSPNSIKVYPAIGGSFFGLAVNQAVDVAAGDQISLICYNAGVWTR